MSRENLIGTDFSSYFTEPRKAREGYERVFNEGAIMTSGTFTNSGPVMNTGHIENQGLLTNSNTITNSGDIFNLCGGSIINSGTIAVHEVVEQCVA